MTEPIGSPLTWSLFGVLIAALLALDLGLLHRKAHEIRFREAVGWSVFWIALALAFNAAIAVWFGPVKAAEFLAGYLIEKALSVDNLFVFVLLFSAFAVPARYQHRVLFWGVFGAVVMRAVFVFVGVAALAAFHWLLYVFGALLLLTGFKLLFAREQVSDPRDQPMFRLFQRVVPSTPEYHGERFWVRQGGRWLATPLLSVLFLIEVTDLVFAVDSIPAVFAVSRDPFIVLTSNIFAVLGLRALYFCLAGFLERLHRLKTGLALVLIFVAVKMLISEHYKVPIGVSLAVIAGILTVAVLASLLERRPVRAGAPEERNEGGGPAPGK